MGVGGWLLWDFQSATLQNFFWQMKVSSQTNFGDNIQHVYYPQKVTK